MDKLAIELKNVGKLFRLYRNKRDRLLQLFDKNKEYYTPKWALKDISLQVKRGTALGIIGKNGSGKSTLLQIICKTMTPSTGCVNVNGKVGALLELGSGFNPEFTGIENIFINGCIQGISKQKIEEKMDKILGFADIGDYVYQPVKTYSSGMKVRLAFAIIANIEADILIIDEALAVGDAFFNQKCMRFIKEYKEENTLLFVSHDANSIMSLCDQTALLSGGKLEMVGKPKEVVEIYVQNLHKQNIDNKDDKRKSEIKSMHTNNIIANGNLEDYKRKWTDYRKKYRNNGIESNQMRILKIEESNTNERSYGSGEVLIKEVEMINTEDNYNSTFYGGEIVEIKIKVKGIRKTKGLIIGFMVKNERGQTMFGDNTYNRIESVDNIVIEEGEEIGAKFVFTMPLLTYGNYMLTASVATGDIDNHKILNWQNDVLLIRSECTNIAAGLAGVPMHLIEVENK